MSISAISQQRETIAATNHRTGLQRENAGKLLAVAWV